MPSTEIPADIHEALAANSAARSAFDRLPPSHRREYLLWVNEAKRPQTRTRRIAGMVQKLDVSGSE